MYLGYNITQQTECTSTTESLSREKKNATRPTIASRQQTPCLPGPDLRGRGGHQPALPPTGGLPPNPSFLANDRCLPCYSNRGLWNQWKLTQYRSGWVSAN